MREKTIAFTGGGSGGHILPIVSLIEYAQQDTNTTNKSKNYYWFGETGSLEEKHAKKLEGVVFIPVLSGKMRRYWTFKSTFQNLFDQVKLTAGIFQSLYYLKKHKIDTLFCKGGYVALPVSLAAWILRIPVLMHESDMHAGLTNKIVSKLSTTIFTGFPGIFKDCIYVGQILSLNLLQQEVMPFEGFDSSKTTILVMGGSQGAESIFETIQGLIKTYPNFQFITITGTKNPQRKEKLTIPGHSWTTGFISQQELAYIYNICDLAITRGAVTSLEEQHLFGMKKIIVPLPFTGGNHQEHNADWFVKERNDYKVLQGDDMGYEIESILSSYVGYKKKTTSVTKEQLDVAHKTIWKELRKN